MQSDARDDRDPVVRVAFDDSGGEVVYDAAREASDDVPVVPVGSPGSAARPLVTATVDGRTAQFESPTTETAREIVGSVAAGDLPTDAASSVVEHDPGTDDFPVPDGQPAVGVRRTLAGAGWVRPASPAGSPLVSPDADDPLALVDRVGLLGRGWGDARRDEPIAGSWRTARDADGDPVVVVNGTDADPRADADRLLLGSLPLRVLDGALAVARATGARDVVVALPEDDPVVAGRVRDAADAVSAETDSNVEVAAVPGSYMAGEPTAVLEALEGADRVEARRRPPGPDEHGLFARPTVVHTPRTLAAVRTLFADPSGFDAGAADPGTRLLTVHGGTRRTVELPTDATIADAVPESEPTPSFACVGGEFGGLTTDLDVPASAPALAGAGLGTNGVLELFGEDDCAVAVAGRRVRFAREENCGRCVPCRAGSVQAHERLRDVYGGEFDATRLRELARTMRNTSLCGFGRDAARPLATALDRFETDLRAHADGRCPTGACSP